MLDRHDEAIHDARRGGGGTAPSRRIRGAPARESPESSGREKQERDRGGGGRRERTVDAHDEKWGWTVRSLSRRSLSQVRDKSRGKEKSRWRQRRAGSKKPSRQRSRLRRRAGTPSPIITELQRIVEGPTGLVARKGVAPFSDKSSPVLMNRCLIVLTIRAGGVCKRRSAYLKMGRVGRRGGGSVEADLGGGSADDDTYDAG